MIPTLKLLSFFECPDIENVNNPLINDIKYSLIDQIYDLVLFIHNKDFKWNYYDFILLYVVYFQKFKYFEKNKKIFEKCSTSGQILLTGFITNEESIINILKSLMVNDPIILSHKIDILLLGVISSKNKEYFKKCLETIRSNYPSLDILYWYYLDNVSFHLYKKRYYEWISILFDNCPDNIPKYYRFVLITIICEDYETTQKYLSIFEDIDYVFLLPHLINRVNDNYKLLKNKCIEKLLNLDKDYIYFETVFCRIIYACLKYNDETTFEMIKFLINDENTWKFLEINCKDIYNHSKLAKKCFKNKLTINNK